MSVIAIEALLTSNCVNDSSRPNLYTQNLTSIESQHLVNKQ